VAAPFRLALPGEVLPCVLVLIGLIGVAVVARIYQPLDHDRFFRGRLYFVLSAIEDALVYQPEVAAPIAEYGYCPLGRFLGRCLLPRFCSSMEPSTLFRQSKELWSSAESGSRAAEAHPSIGLNSRPGANRGWKG
jgi:hypothetical protein